jgi:hypothetical protein
MHNALVILGYYSLSLTIFGTVFNIIIAYISIKSKSNSSFFLLRYLAFSDTLALYFWNLSHFSEAIFNINLENYSMISCKLGDWIQFSSLQTSAWILVLISIDRYLIFRIKNWQTIYFTNRIANMCGFTLTLIVFLINSNVIFTFGYELETIMNGTKLMKTTQCFTTIPSTYWMTYWNHVHSYLYSFVPFILLGFINVLLLIDLHFLKQSINTNLRRNKKKIRMTVTVIIMTVLFILFTCPFAVSSQYYSSLVQTFTGNVIIYACDSLGFSFNAFNIFILCFTNDEFLIDLKRHLFGVQTKSNINNKRGINNEINLNEIQSAQN